MYSNQSNCKFRNFTCIFFSFFSRDFFPSFTLNTEHTAAIYWCRLPALPVLFFIDKFRITTQYNRRLHTALLLQGLAVNPSHALWHFHSSEQLTITLCGKRHKEQTTKAGLKFQACLCLRMCIRISMAAWCICFCSMKWPILDQRNALYYSDIFVFFYLSSYTLLTMYDRPSRCAWALTMMTTNPSVCLQQTSTYWMLCDH